MNRDRPGKLNLGFGQRVKPDEQHFTRKLKSKAAQGVQGYPIATIAYYGLNLDLATKVAVGIVQKDQQVSDMQRWFSDLSDIRSDHGINRAIVKFLEQHHAKSVVISEGILGCPHEEGTDYPEGESCPQCLFWANRNRWTGKIISSTDT